MYVSVRLTDGLGNRLFQIAALLGYAEKHGHMPIFVRPWITVNASHPGSRLITDYFPHIPVNENVPEGPWTEIKEHADDVFTYRPLAHYETHVLLVGYFQTEQYGPIGGLPLPALLKNIDLGPTVSWERTAFLHVRRGDYLSPYTAHHNVDLRAYYRRALQLLDSFAHIAVCSDDIAWCKQHLPALYADIVRADQWLFLTADDCTTLAAMTQCGVAAVCANSTYSWWGAFWSRAPVKIFPGTWGYPPLPPARHIYPAGSVVLPC